MDLAVGGNFVPFGILMREVLVQAGLERDHCLVDVGCGSGRLAKALADHLRGPYLGLDVVRELLSYARSICNRPDWRFELVDEIRIPERDERADMVCFFSVFTHLLHEDSYRYLLEAHRVLKPSGRVVFSFLEFRNPCTWVVFEGMVEHRKRGDGKHHDQFLSRDAIAAWAEHAGFEIVVIHDGEKPHIRVPSPMALDDKRTIEGETSLGQSICVLEKR
jgi:SAM-dependent methyltransferase